MYRLHVVPAHGDPFDRLLDGDSLVIGRSSESDLMIADRFLSRQHARLFKQGDDWLAEDLGSRNGTLLNGRAIEEPTAVKVGDDLQLCGSVVSLKATTAAPNSQDGSSASDFGQHTVFRRATELIDSQAESASDTEAPDALRRLADRLSMLNDIHQTLSASIQQQELLDLILARAFDHLRPEEGVIYLRGDDGEFYRAGYRSVPGQETNYAFSTTLIKEVAEKGMAALVLDVETDERFAEARSILSSGIQSLVAAPLLDPEGTLGMIALSSRAHLRRFDEPDMELLVSMASVAAMHLRNMSLAAEAAERQRMEEELRLARQIQVALLPLELPDVPGYSLHGGNLPSRGVSGDLYEVFERNDGREYVFLVADVSGKGIAAAFLTASLEALAAGPIEVGHPPDRVCALVSRRLFARTLPAKYATAFLAVLDLESGKIHFTNAGHNPAIVVRADGSSELLGPTGLPIGLMQDASYGLNEAQLGRGDTLVMYTDGITEAENLDEEEFGTDRLVATCVELRGEQLEALSEGIERALKEFVGGVRFADDRTLVMLRREAD